ncbi:type II toxin-antitoxin system RelE/ParE family toxin [bacterium]|nr:type II toxin-antitoxin system RelE/ParE family toxin [bacterium]
MTRLLSGVNLSKYRIFETEEFIKRLDNLTRRDITFVRNKLTIYVYPQLKEEPTFGQNIKKLRGYEPDTWRYRIGRFRLFYHVDPSSGVIYMLTIDHRKDAYR